MGANQGAYLQPRHFEAGLSYRYLHADEMFQGSNYRPEFQRGGTNANFKIHSFDLAISYGITKRLSTTLDIPVVSGSVDVVSNRVHNSATGLGDIRLVADFWLLDPDNHPDGNLAVGLGMKFPTGESDAMQMTRLPGGVMAVRPLDPALQPGDGGWGLIAETFGFLKVYKHTYLYVAGSYLFNPKQKSKTEFTTDPTVHLTVPDMYMGRGGISYVVWPSQGISLSLGGRIEGVPVTDAIGGADDGFRRPGYGIYVEPGIAWDRGKNHFGLNTPVALERNRERSVRDRNLGTAGVGGMANFLIIANYSYRF